MRSGKLLDSRQIKKKWLNLKHRSLLCPFWTQVVEETEKPPPSTPRLWLLRDGSTVPAGRELTLPERLNAAGITMRKWENISAPYCRAWIELMTAAAPHVLDLSQIELSYINY